MRNRMIFQATLQTRSKQMGSNLSKDLQKKYGKKSARVIEGDSVKIVRGEFKGVDGKISKISTQKTSVAIVDNETNYGKWGNGCTNYNFRKTQR